ncbi:tetratricopeptide repeat protein [Algiphilus sp.]|uniref:tetratricopeptide repeat protein n=1 Tax=Algiphilus sp. TaxID=1872431 RepID=UPI003B527160
MGLALALIGTWLAYQPAIPGFFLLDDFDNLSALKGGVTDWGEYTQYLRTGNAGPLGRPVAKTSFLINDFAWPSNPGGFKHVNLMIHLLCGLLAFLLARLLLRQRCSEAAANGMALFVAALWLLHPAQVSTVMYVVQRMTQLSALFVLMGVAVHVALRLNRSLSEGRRLALMSLSLLLFAALASYSKESGILLPVYLLVTEVTLLAAVPASRSLHFWKWVALHLPTFCLLAYLAYIPRWAPSYESRDFTLYERLLTQPVALFDYLWNLVSMQVHGMGLFHDDFPIYSSLLNPVAALAMIGVLAAAAIALIYRRRCPVLAFSVLWFLGGHLLESTTVALELYFEHRNYLPFVGPIFGFVVLGHGLLVRVGEDLRKFGPIFGVLLALISGTITYGHAHEWGDRGRLIPIWAAEHPDSPRAQRTYAQFLAGEGLPLVALEELNQAYERFPRDLSIPVMSIDIACSFGLQPRFEIPELVRRISEHSWTDGLRPAMESLVGRLLSTECVQHADAVHDLIRAIPELGNSEHHKNGVASMFVLDGELYLKQGKPLGALESFQKVDNMKPSASSALRLSNLFLITGNFDIARRALEVAKERDTTDDGLLGGEREALYEEKFRLIDDLKQRSATRSAEE